MPKDLKCPLLLLWWFFFTSCVSLPNVPVCHNLTQKISNDEVTGHIIWNPSPTCMEKIGEAECGFCVYTVSGKQVFVGEKSGHYLNGKAWSQVKEESVIMPASSYAAIAAYLEVTKP